MGLYRENLPNLPVPSHNAKAYQILYVALYPCHTTTTNSTSRHELIDYGIRGVRQSLWTESLHSTNRLRYRYDIATNIRENRFDSA